MRQFFIEPYHERVISTGVLCDALRDLVPFVEFKKREKHPCRSVNFSKVEKVKSLTEEKLLN